mmetsp:Transcript_15120/g.32487  ORF Transcript_15120/g.32487 Transcript_15120/m.32487 type:complete len:216 (-) Transcript_15120:41-688(-)
MEVLFFRARLPPRRRRRVAPHPCSSYLPRGFEIVQGGAQKIVPAGPVLEPNLVRIFGYLIGTGAIVVHEFLLVAKAVAPCYFPRLRKRIEIPLFTVLFLLLLVVFAVVVAGGTFLFLLEFRRRRRRQQRRRVQHRRPRQRNEARGRRRGWSSNTNGGLVFVDDGSETKLPCEKGVNSRKRKLAKQEMVQKQHKNDYSQLSIATMRHCLFSCMVMD